MKTLTKLTIDMLMKSSDCSDRQVRSSSKDKLLHQQLQLAFIAVAGVSAQTAPQDEELSKAAKHINRNFDQLQPIDHADTNTAPDVFHKKSLL